MIGMPPGASAFAKTEALRIGVPFSIVTSSIGLTVASGPIATVKPVCVDLRGAAPTLAPNHIE
jgi:hypothetical protein